MLSRTLSPNNSKPLLPLSNECMKSRKGKLALLFILIVTSSSSVFAAGSSCPTKNSTSEELTSYLQKSQALRAKIANEAEKHECNTLNPE